jgi:uncharacterized coiled-coil protein SlyX
MSPPRVTSSPETDSTPSKKLSSPLQINGIKQLNGHAAIEPYKMSGFVPEDRNNRLNELLSSVVRSEALLINTKLSNVQDEKDVVSEESVAQQEDSIGDENPMVAAKDKVIARLETLLHTANQELRLRDEEVARLTSIRTEVEAELEELTASLFQVF